MTAPIRIGNASGFYGDRFSAVQEMLTGGPLDVLTGDYLAELTMLILGRDRLKDPSLGYARTFLKQLETGLGEALDRGVTIVSNAGGLNPAGLAQAITDLAGRLGLHPKIAYVEGDDLLPRAAELDLGTPLTANAYLGAWGIADALQAGADVVVTGRVTDASVIVGPAAAHHGWKRTQYDEIAGAVVAGHVIECGCQATGGNYAFFGEIRDLGRPGFPIAEIARRRQQRDHQARQHRRRGHDRHGQGATAVRGRRCPVRRSGRDHPPRHDRAQRRRTGSRPDQRRPG